LERCESKDKSQFRVFALPNFQQLTFEFVSSCEMGRGGFNAIPCFLDVREEFRDIHVIEGSTNASKVGE
jgi:hypothetical protein